MISEAVFCFFAVLAILAASQVIIARNPVRAVLSLVLTFFATAVLWLLLEIEFLAITLILVYVGAVMVLFLFVVMMLDIELTTLKEGFTRHLPLGGSVAVLVVVGLLYAVSPKQLMFESLRMPAQEAVAKFSNIKLLGEVLYTQYLYPLEIAAMLLLVAIIAAISLTFRGSKDSKAQNPAEQVAVKKSDRLRLIKG